MSKHPSPRMDQLRALREAKYARKNETPRPAATATEAPPEAAVKRAPNTAKPKTEKAKIEKPKTEKPKTAKTKKKAAAAKR